MMHPRRFPLVVSLLALAVAVSLPSVAGARSERSGPEGRGRASEARGGHAGKREFSRRGEGRSNGPRAYRPRAGERERERAGWRGPGSRGSYPRGFGARGEVRRRDPQADPRADVRWRDSGPRGDASGYRPRVRYRHDGPSYSSHRPRHAYYTRSFHRPRFVHRSGFSLGFVLGSLPPHGYRYFDPYCDRGFRSLGLYYDHCDHRGHPAAILVLELDTGDPIASCIHDDGDWVIDDCY